MSLPLYIACRLYGSSRGTRRVSRPAVRIAVAGIAVGLAVMIISVCTVLGFKHTIRDKVVGFNGHITVSNFMTLRTTDQSQPINASDSLVRRLRALPGVRHVQRYSTTQGVLKTGDDFLGVCFKGFDATADTTFLHAGLVSGRTSFAGARKPELLISQSIADKLRLHVGSKVRAYFLSSGDVRARAFTVTGIYRTNISKYDDIMCFTDLRTVSCLNGWHGAADATGCELLLADFNHIDDVEDVVIDRVNRTLDADGHTLSSVTVKEQMPQIFSWLALLDLNVWVILALMTAVAGFTIVSGLLIIMLERTQMIGLLKALGARGSMVRRTFRWLALFIVLRGMVWGNVIGLGLCLLQRYTGIVTLDPQVYYVSEAPVEISLPMIVLLNAATLIAAVAVLVLPSYYVSTIQPAQTMRTE